MDNVIVFGISIFICLLLVGPIVKADVVSINSGGGNHSTGYDIVIINPNTYIEGFFFGFNFTETVNLSESISGDNTSAGSGGSDTESRGYHTIIVETITTEFGPGSIIIAKITVTNDKRYYITDSELRYFLTDSEGNKYEEKVETITQLNPGENVFERQLTLPTQAPFGEWKFNVIFNRGDLFSATSFDSFRVIEKDYRPLITTTLLFVVGLVSLITFLFFFRRKKMIIAGDDDDDDDENYSGQVGVLRK